MRSSGGLTTSLENISHKGLSAECVPVTVSRVQYIYLIWWGFAIDWNVSNVCTAWEMCTQSTAPSIRWVFPTGRKQKEGTKRERNHVLQNSRAMRLLTEQMFSLVQYPRRFPVFERKLFMAWSLGVTTNRNKIMRGRIRMPRFLFLSAFLYLSPNFRAAKGENWDVSRNFAGGLSMDRLFLLFLVLIQPQLLFYLGQWLFSICETRSKVANVQCGGESANVSSLVSVPQFPHHALKTNLP